MASLMHGVPIGEFLLSCVASFIHISAWQGTTHLVHSFRSAEPRGCLSILIYSALCGGSLITAFPIAAVFTGDESLRSWLVGLMIAELIVGMVCFEAALFQFGRRELLPAAQRDVSPDAAVVPLDGSAFSRQGASPGEEAVPAAPPGSKRSLNGLALSEKKPAREIDRALQKRRAGLLLKGRRLQYWFVGALFIPMVPAVSSTSLSLTRWVHVFLPLFILWTAAWTFCRVLRAPTLLAVTPFPRRYYFRSASKVPLVCLVLAFLCSVALNRSHDPEPDRIRPGVGLVPVLGEPPIFEGPGGYRRRATPVPDSLWGLNIPTYDPYEHSATDPESFVVSQTRRRLRDLAGVRVPSSRLTELYRRTEERDRTRWLERVSEENRKAIEAAHTAGGRQIPLILAVFF